MQYHSFYNYLHLINTYNTEIVRVVWNTLFFIDTVMVVFLDTGFCPSCVFVCLRAT